MERQKRKLTKDLLIITLKMFPDEILKDLLYDRAPLPGMPQVISLPDEGMVILDSPEKIKKAITFKLNQLDKAGSVHEIFYWITKPNRLQILQFVTGIYEMEKEEYSKILKDIWMATEFPHQMPIPKLVDMFNQTEAHLLMSEDEMCIYTNLPETVTVFRGVQDKKAKLRGLSWTTEYEVAEWFANRWQRGKLYQAEIKKKHIFMFTNGRSEHECVVNPRYLKNVRQIYSL
ncbi:MAG TPA: hypothetical protein DSN98_08725 [Thermoplasmata archaeon]|nr:MAG TPA: hypothetical protein DSN98_08725 [Thermoplasmata archaeon]